MFVAFEKDKVHTYAYYRETYDGEKCLLSLTPTCLFNHSFSLSASLSPSVSLSLCLPPLSLCLSLSLSLPPSLSPSVSLPLSLSLCLCLSLSLSLSGAKCIHVGATKLPYDYRPLLLYNGELTCQKKTGRVQTIRLSSHNYSDDQDLSDDEVRIKLI